MINIRKDFKILLRLAKLSKLTDEELKVITKFCSNDQFSTFNLDEKIQLCFAFERIFENSI